MKLKSHTIDGKRGARRESNRYERPGCDPPVKTSGVEPDYGQRQHAGSRHTQCCRDRRSKGGAEQRKTGTNHEFHCRVPP